MARASLTLGFCKNLFDCRGLKKPWFQNLLASRILRTASRLRSTDVHKQNAWKVSHTRSLGTRPDIVTTMSLDNGCKLEDVQVDREMRFIHLKWTGDESSYPFPVAFLRDNCLCPSCFEASSGGRLILMRDFNPRIHVKEAKIEDDSALAVCWEDGHTSRYPPDWLASRQFTSAANAERAKWFERKPKLWGKESMESIPSDTLENILTDDKALLRWLISLEELGLFIIRGAPTEIGQLSKIGDRVAYLRPNNYGSTFTVKAKKDPTNIAYTNASIGLHIDLPYYDYIPGIQMLHCIVQAATDGGENEFSDGFNAARQLREEYPKYYKTLTTVPCDFSDIGVDYYKYYQLSRKPVIALDDNGEVEQITYNNQTRDSFQSIPIEQVQPLYDALKKFDDILYDKKNVIEVKLKEGEIVCFHNFRVLHGRKGYSMDAGGFRHLEGGYIDWDELRSRRRVLQKELGRCD